MSPQAMIFDSLPIQSKSTLSSIMRSAVTFDHYLPSSYLCSSDRNTPQNHLVPILTNLTAAQFQLCITLTRQLPLCFITFLGPKSCYRQQIKDALEPQLLDSTQPTSATSCTFWTQFFQYLGQSGQYSPFLRPLSLVHFEPQKMLAEDQIVDDSSYTEDIAYGLRLIIFCQLIIPWEQQRFIGTLEVIYLICLGRPSGQRQVNDDLLFTGSDAKVRGWVLAVRRQCQR